MNPWLNLKRLFRPQRPPTLEGARPPTASRRQVEEYVERELRASMSPGWAWDRPDAGRLVWLITKTEVPAGEWPMQEYGLHVSDDLHWFIASYGNQDVGAGSLAQAFQTARVIPSTTLAHYPLRACLRFLMQHCHPNEWGYT